jgi:hypothetical protein
MATHANAAPGARRWARVGTLFLHELRAVIPPTLFFFVGFNLILFTKRLILAQYLIEFAGFFVATVAALVVGKAVLVADKMPFLGRFDNAPLAYPILFKTIVYAFFVFVARLIEALVHFLVAGGALGGGRFIEHILGDFTWSRFIAAQLWIVVLFLIYVTASELNKLFGDGELFKILFTRRPSELNPTRRTRIRLLSRLAKLTDAHSVDALADPKSTSHAELVAILRSLAQRTEPPERRAA